MKASMALSLFSSRYRPHLAIVLTSRMGDLSRPVTGNCNLDKECGMGPRIKEGAMRWQRHLVSRNPRKYGLRKSTLIPRLIRRRKELHLNLSNTDILHRSYSSHLSSRNLGRYTTLQSRCCLTIHLRSCNAIQGYFTTNSTYVTQLTT